MGDGEAIKTVIKPNSITFYLDLTLTRLFSFLLEMLIGLCRLSRTLHRK